MPQTVYIGGKVYPLQPSTIIGQGGEAVVYKYSPSEALKVYLDPDDPVFLGTPEAQQGARFRLQEQQRKLPAFPITLPDHVVAPHVLAYDQRAGGQIVGYTMPLLTGMHVLLSYADRKFCELGGIDANQTIGIFRNLHTLVTAVHGKRVVIGDFNDLNVLVAPNDEVYLVDADSMQFGSFLCRTFTTRFVDPLHCAPDKLLLAKPHSLSSDWYAFATMLFQSLLFINPYGGVHRPKSGPRLRDAARILNRVTVFSPDVVYPKAALPFSILPDSLLDYFTELYVQDKRGAFPISLLEEFRWTKCSSCGTMHARQTCPACATPGVVKQVVTIHGDVTATRRLRTPGQILFATSQGGEVRYVYHESGTYKREGGRAVLNGNLDHELRIRIWGDKTVFAKGSALVAIGPDDDQSHFDTQQFNRLPIFDANAHHLYWIDGDRLVHDGRFGPTSIGDVLLNQTLVWVGERFGFGFYRAGSLVRGLVFDTERAGMNDTVPLPPLAGNLIDATCTFADHVVWFMLTVEQGGDIKNHCYVITDGAQLLAHAEALQGDGTWLGEGIRGRFARGQQLFAATDTGIVRIGIQASSLQVERTYPTTEPFVRADTQLLPSREGIVAVSSREIVLLQIRQSN